MTLPPNLPAKKFLTFTRKEYGHVKPWRPSEEQVAKVTPEQVNKQKQLIASRANHEETIARRATKQEKTRARLLKKLKS